MLYNVESLGSQPRLREGVNFLQKPFLPAHLLQTLRQRLDT